MEQLRAENAQLAQQLALLSAQVAQLSAHVPAAPPPPRRKCQVGRPDKFDGNPDMFPVFMGQCRLYISVKADDFPTDRDKVGFIISMLSGPAARWGTPLLTQPSPLMDNFVGFCEHMRLMYEDPIKTQTATRRLKALRQGRRPLQGYISEFRLLSQDSAWNEAALVDAFQDGLSEEMLDELARVDIPPDLTGLIHLCLRIDARLQQRRSRRAIPETRTAPVVGATPVQREEPMELGAARPRLSVAEMNRRRSGGLCFYCGDPGHLAAFCPKKRRGASVPELVPRLPSAPLSGNGPRPT